ncbi:3'-5' exonuclease [Cupriavidus basilensis]|uniref:3'-5' exonuclease n=1 Tax=Cupriavidus basilensis TaxID=68895 RepID=A0A643FL77_9BURK|nr:3'-5' exonuclease [Cupriavidus basilensis]MCP3017868.1 3'-5' exonuclease [Cupriavidus basilensis]MDR3385165.1 3'-5' exonuclease [Cupriavidus basilensis]QOT74970.1 3'-5' exonuclease [Cupriavidus basilensis]
MTPVLVFDIETIPDVDGLRRLHDHPDSMTDAEVAEHAFAARREKNGTDFLPHYLQRIAAISCVLRRNQRDGTPVFHVGSLGTLEDGEAVLIQKFYDLVARYSPQMVSWNGGGFDLPVLHYRGLVHGIVAPRYWEMGDGSESDSREFKWNNYISRYHMRHLDLMDLLAMYQPRASAPLDDLAKLCGFPGKMGMDGSKVWQAYQDGQLPAIRDYCETDVVNTYLVYCRFQLMRGGLTPKQFDTEIEFVQESLAELPGSQWIQYLQSFRIKPVYAGGDDDEEPEI